MDGLGRLLLTIVQTAFLCIPIGLSLWALLDCARRPSWAWALTTRSQQVWMATILCGILFVPFTGMRWEWLPNELGCGRGMTCWRRLRDGNNAGVWQRLHEVLPAEFPSVQAGSRPGDCSSNPKKSFCRFRHMPYRGGGHNADRCHLYYCKIQVLI